MVTTPRIVKGEDFLSYCGALENQLATVLDKLYSTPGIDIYLSGGSLTIYMLNQLKDKAIPTDYIEDIDIFVKADIEVSEALTKDLTETADFSLMTDKRYSSYKSTRRKFINLKNNSNSLNVIISKENLEETLDDFDLNCNQVGLDLLTNEFCYSNTFINFLDTEILEFIRGKVRPNSLGRFLYKVNQYKLAWSDINEEEIIFIMNYFDKYDGLFFNLAKKSSRELIEKTKELVEHLAYLFEEYELNANDYCRFVLKDSLQVDNIPAQSNILFYRSQEIEL